MIRLFRFKQTQSINFLKAEGIAQCQLNLKQLLEQAQQLRSELIQYEYEDVLAGNLDKTLQLEQMLINYIFILDELIDQKVQDKISLIFSWNDSYNPNKYILSDQWYYEYSCHLYNLSIIQYYLANNLKEVKEALTKSRYGLWTLCKLQEILPFVQTDIICHHSDLAQTHVRMLYSLSYGFGYKVLYDNFSLKPGYKPQEQIFTFLVEAVNQYKLSIQQLQSHQQSTSKHIPPLIYSKLMQSLTYQFAEYKIQLCIELSAYHSIQAVENPKYPHMGYALAYVQQAQKVGQNYFKLYKQKDEIIQNLILKAQQCQQEYEIKNQQIYKQSCPSDDKLFNYLLEDNRKIRYKQPECFQKKGDQLTQLQEDKQKQVLELIKDINQRKLQVQKQYTDLENQFVEFNENYHIQKMLDANSAANQLQIPESLKKVVEFIKSKGGYKGFEQQIQEILKIAQQIGQKTILIRTEITNEEINDQKFRDQYENQWNAIKSDQLNQKFKKRLETLIKSLTQASLINKQILQTVSENKLYFELAEGQEQLIISQLSNSLNLSALFQQKNLSQLKRLTLYQQNMKNELIGVQKKLNQILKFIDDLGLDKARTQQMDQFLFQKILQQIDDQISEFNQQVQGIDFKKISQLAASLQDQHFSVLIDSSDNEIEKGFQIVSDQFYNLDYAKSFYNQVNQQVCLLYAEVNDFIRARQLEREQFKP